MLFGPYLSLGCYTWPVCPSWQKGGDVVLRGRLLFDYVILFLKLLFFLDLHFFFFFFNFKSLIHYALCSVFDCWLTIVIWLLMLTHMLLFMFFLGSIYLYIIVINIVYLSLFPHMHLCFILVFEKKVSNLYTRHSTSL